MLKKVSAVFLLIIILGVNALSASQSINVPATNSSPKLDGKANDICWEKIKWHNNFTLLSNPSQKAAAQTKFKMLHDNKSLYIIAKLDEPLMKKIKSNVTQRDGKVYHDDCLEIFIDVNKDQNSYYHFIINPKGTIYDAQRRQGGHVSTKKWDASGIKTATRKYSDSWIIEMAIPFVTLGIEPGNSGIWGFNIARERQAQKEISTFIPLSGGFHQPSLFGNLILKNIDLKPFSWEIKAPYAIKTVSVNGKIFVKSKLFVTNDTGKFRFIKIKTKLLNYNKSKVATLGLADKTAKETQITTPAGKNGNTQLSVEIINRRDGNLLATRLFPLKIQYSPLKINLTQPFYRNCIFATQSIKELKGEIISDLSNLEQTTLVLELKTPAGQVLSSHRIKQLKRLNKFSLSIPALKYGTYQLCAKLQKNKQNIFSKQIAVKKLAPFKGEVRIDKNLITLVDGKPFLPYGWFSFVKDIQLAGKQGYNVAVDYNAYYKSDEKLKAWLDKNLKNGLKVLIYPYPKRKYNNAEKWHKPLSAQEAAGIRNFVRKWKSHPAILGWYMADEPELRPALPARMTAIKNICEEEDPYHPCVLLNDTINGIHKYIDGGDVFNPDPYPLFINNKYAAKPIEKVGKFIEEIAIAGKNKKAAWITPQGFNYGDYGRVNNRAPNFLELRNMQYQAIIAGATGFTWYTYYRAKPYPDLIYGVEFLGKEAKLLKNLILSPQKRIILKTNDKYIKAAYYKNIDGSDWIIAVNNAIKIKNVKLSLPAGSPKKWYVVSEKCLVKTAGKTLNDKFSIYDTNIYTSNKDLADKLSAAATQRKIDKMKTTKK